MFMYFLKSTPYNFEYKPRPPPPKKKELPKAQIQTSSVLTSSYWDMAGAGCGGEGPQGTWESIRALQDFEWANK